MPTAKAVVIPYTPFPLWGEIHAHPARFRIIDCGRRFGKTWGAIPEVGKVMGESYGRTGKPARGLVVSPTTPLLREDWRTALEVFKGAILKVNLSEMRMDLVTGELEFKSADSEAGVGRGAGYDIVLFDEAARIPERIWEEEIRPSLADRRGKAIFISTPNGRNWFYRLWRVGQGADADYKSWKHSTLDGWANRFWNDPVRLKDCQEEWDQIERTTSLKTFQQEYLADFLEGEGQLWSMKKCIRGQLRPAIPGRYYVAGLDVAHVEDWMATVVIEVESKQVVAVFRSRHRDWSLQKAEAMEVLRQYPKVRLLIDATGVGDPIYQDFVKSGISAEPIVFSKKVKKDMVENLSVAIDHGYLGIPDTNETQWFLDELRSYEETKPTEHSDTVRYGAPSGQHDDGVTALMLAAWAMRFDMIQPATTTQNQGDPTLQDWMNYQRKADAWRKVCPNLSVPHHPRALQWKLNTRWRRAYQPRTTYA